MEADTSVAQWLAEGEQLSLERLQGLPGGRGRTNVGPARGAWVAQWVERPTSAQVMMSRSVGSSPASGSVLTARTLEPALDSVSLPLSASPLLVLCLSVSLSLSLKNKETLNNNNNKKPLLMLSLTPRDSAVLGLGCSLGRWV